MKNNGVIRRFHCRRQIERNISFPRGVILRSRRTTAYRHLVSLFDLQSRLIGSGFIGGKAAGMLLAQKILFKEKSLDWGKYLEPHDSFYIGSDVFYSYIVENGWWNLLMKQKTKDGYFAVAPEMKENLLQGKFPEQIRERFQEIIEYFGQSPIIVRSSSLLEDSFGNAFAGKYESIFLVNQGDPERRYSELEEAVRRLEEAHSQAASEGHCRHVSAELGHVDPGGDERAVQPDGDVVMADDRGRCPEVSGPLRSLGRSREVLPAPLLIRRCLSQGIRSIIESDDSVRRCLPFHHEPFLTGQPSRDR